MKLTVALIILLTAVFLIVEDNLIDFYGLSGNNVAERPYTLITSIFLHGNITHLLSNVFVLFFFSSALESEIGKRRTFLIFLGGSLLGNVFSLLYYDPSQMGIGASGGIFALVGAGMLIKPFDVSFYPFVAPVPLALLGFMYAAYNAYAFFFDAESNVSYIAHFGGLFIGLAYGFHRQGIKKSLLIILFSALVLYILALLLLRQNLFI